jgi:3-oxoacyl-[acyl-carrier protein] reductase
MPRMLIAGSSRGIGAALARIAVAHGWDVILHGRSDSTALRALQQELGAPVVSCDGMDREATFAALEAAGALDGIEALVNTLGAVAPSQILEDSDQLWQSMYAANVLAPLHFCQAVIPGMLRSGTGAIVNVSSIRGYDTLAEGEVAAYSAAKAALMNLTSTLARSLAPTIRVNCVAPGFTLTDMAASWSDRVRASAQTALLQRAAEPAEIAEALLFLASDRASFITGQTLLVDGGFELATT